MADDGDFGAPQVLAWLAFTVAVLLVWPYFTPDESGDSTAVRYLVWLGCTVVWGVWAGGKR